MARNFYEKKLMLASWMCDGNDFLCGVNQAANMKCLTAADFCLKLANCNV